MVLLFLACLIILPAAIGYAIKFGGILFEGLAALIGVTILLTGAVFSGFAVLSLLFG